MILERSRGPRLDAALTGLAGTFRGMTARPDEHNCECHWGSAAELALLKVPDRELDPDLLRRAWAATDWRDHAAVLRRILPQLVNTLVDGRIRPGDDPDEIGQSLARGRWRQWPAEQAQAVREFLEAWWARTLTDPHPVVPAHDVFAFCAVAAGDLGTWLGMWQAARHPVADRHLAAAVAHWADDLLYDDLPWAAADRAQKLAALTELAAWLVRHAPARLRDEGLLHQVRLLGIDIPARWDDPHWPDGHA